MGIFNSSKVVHDRLYFVNTKIAMRLLSTSIEGDLRYESPDSVSVDGFDIHGENVHFA